MPLAAAHRLRPQDERDLRNFYDTLSEKERRRLAAVEAKRLPHGGIRYVADLLGCSVRTVRRGIGELSALGGGDPVEGRVRREGAGRPKKAGPVRG